MNIVLDKKHTITGTVPLYYICIMHQSIVILPPNLGEKWGKHGAFLFFGYFRRAWLLGDFFFITPRPLYVAVADPGEGPGGLRPTSFFGLNWGPKGRKSLGGERPSPLLYKGPNDRAPPPPLPQGLDPALCGALCGGWIKLVSSQPRPHGFTLEKWVGRVPPSLCHNRTNGMYLFPLYITARDAWIQLLKYVRCHTNYILRLIW